MVSFLPKFSQAADDFAKRNKLWKLGDSKEAAAKWVAAPDGTLEAWDEWYHSAGKELTELAKKNPRQHSILQMRCEFVQECLQLPFSVFPFCMTI